MNGLNFSLDLKNVEIINQIMKIFLINILTFITTIKITNSNKIIKMKICIEILMISILCGFIRHVSNQFNSIICVIFFMVYIYKNYTKNNITHSIIAILISLSINYSIYLVAIIMAYYPNVVLNIKSNVVSLGIILVIYIILILGFFRIKKFKNGILFLQNKNSNEYIDILVLNISVTILIAMALYIDYNPKLSSSLFISLILFTIIMFITIQKSLQLYYKQKLLVQELNETKTELEKKTKEIEELEKENLSFSKKSHTLAHKQKSLEYKLQEILNKTEISKEEAGEVRDRLKGIEKDLYKEKTVIELDKTGISQIDDMLKYMQSECTKNKIDFELQINGNIHYMTNNLISKEDLETLLADHIKNAIIAINHTENINRSILVRLGKIDETYALYIYDSGIEFEKETLENLGKKPSTTHANEGGTGMGFMNTFDTLKKYKASLIIEEYNEPSKDNYTKAIMIKFDNKNQFEIISYRQNSVIKK